MPQPYAPHESFTDPAREKPELWRIPAVLGTILCVMIVLQTTVVAFAALGGGGQAGEIAGRMMASGGPSAGETLALLMAFGFAGIGLALGLQIIHQRSWLTLLGPLHRALPDFLRVTGAVAALLALLWVFLPEGLPSVPNPAMPITLWALLLPVSALAILIQSGTEELFFRGYLQQQLAARLNHPAVWMVAPSVFFALLHAGPSTGANSLLFMCWATGFAMAAADLTARTGTLGAAIGLHFANNAVAFMLVSLQGPSSGLALRLIEVAASDPRLQSLMLPEFASLLCCWLVARVAVRA